MINIVGHFVKNETHTKNIKILVWVHIIFQPTIYNFGGLRRRLRYSIGRKKIVELRNIQESVIMFLVTQPEWFSIKDSNI